MQYYDPNDKSPRRWAMIAAGVYALLFAGSFAFVSFDFSPEEERPGDMILVDFTDGSRAAEAAREDERRTPRA